ncbi:MAG: hypothetical protein QOD61_683 [Solirubrobacteraceae bacterium]|nr:hypothetical protein [Solirubrobacteraceae bacterium]
MTGIVDQPSPPAQETPVRPRRWRRLGLGVGLLVVGALVLGLALAHRPRPPAASAALPPVIELGAPMPGAAPAAAATATATAGRSAGRAAIVAVRPRAEQRRDLARFHRRSPTHVPARWVAGFYPLYDLAARTFAVNWLLLASIHQQETSFSTAADTYHGLNFAGCCGGPMQFNVTNGPPTTWALVGDAYRLAPRPSGYPHPTRAHPSIYDDFDAVMAAGRLLSADGAGTALDVGAWEAAYSYYGHDVTGVTYADQVLARAISWSQGGFCINCPLDQTMVDAVHAAYGAPVLAELEAEAAAKRAAAAAKRAAAAARRAAARARTG